MERYLRKGLYVLGLIAASAVLVSCGSTSTGASGGQSGAVGEERTVEQAREDGCQAAVGIMELNFTVLQDIDELIDRGFLEWTDVNSDVWGKGDLVAEYAQSFNGMGLEQDASFRAAAEDVARAYSQFRSTRFLDAGAQWTDAADHFRGSVQELNEAMVAFADLCPE